jgi:hypothetical protein
MPIYLINIFLEGKRLRRVFLSCKVVPASPRVRQATREHVFVGRLKLVAAD